MGRDPVHVNAARPSVQNGGSVGAALPVLMPQHDDGIVEGWPLPTRSASSKSPPLGEEEILPAGALGSAGLAPRAVGRHSIGRPAESRRYASCSDRPTIAQGRDRAPTFRDDPALGHWRHRTCEGPGLAPGALGAAQR